MNTVDICNRIDAELKKRNLTKKDFYDAVGITSGAYSQWRTGRTAPSRNTLRKIAQLLGWTEDYLINGFVFSTDARIEISNAERNMIEKYRELDMDGRQTVDFILESELKRTRDMAAKKVTMLIPLRRSLQKASAGRGCYLGPEEFETVYVPDTPLNRRASFIVGVAGRSMEPLYKDGDQLLVERAEDIDVGEIGVFTVRGDGFVKKRGENELISLNSDYPNVPLTEESWCNGRVIGVLRSEDIK
jgi:phage repressor protein C with HTH and peptisase S24 domain